nr:rhodanese-like domain-containing protein [Caldimonas mangrovi]
MARGATAWDVRSAADYAQGHLPGAVRAEWGGELTLTALEAAVSQAGIDLSREVLVYGSAGEPRARRLYEVLQRVAPGRVHWLVGGVQEWALAGQPLSRVPAVRAPVPQRLVVLREDGVAGELRMAADALRRSRPWPQPESVALMQARAD